MTLILGKSVATAEQLASYLLSVNSSPKFSRAISAVEFCQLYIDIGNKEDVRGDLACVQCFKETGNLKYGGDVLYTQNNFAGLGATGNGVRGCIFPDIETGILAHIQHLKTYATKAALNEPCVDPRRTTWFVNTKGGTCTTIEGLAGTWAVPGYSTSKYSSLETANNAKDSYGYQIVNILNKVLKITIKEETKMSYRIANDAGHGSNTAGKCTPDGYREHWINVKCANYFDIAMKRCGIETVKIGWDDTNSTNDSDLALATRQQLISASKCDASISWHANAHGDGKTYTTGQGVETLIHNYASKVGDSEALANAVQSYLIKGTSQKNRGVKKSNLAMCNCTAMGVKAAILVEVGFMTNEYEKNLLLTDAFCFECAEEAAQGVCKYFGVKYVAPATTVKPTTTQTITNYTTYVVQSGDTLSKIGTAKKLNWKDIAELNGITSPYHLKVGQVLKLPQTAGTTVTESTVKVPLKITQTKKDIQKFLNTYYGTDIKKVLGASLVEDGAIGNKSKLALGIAFQVELNKLGANLVVDGKIGTASASAFTKYIGTLKNGTKNSIFVTLWQCILVAHDINPNGIDGAFGSGCAAATNTLFGKIGLVKDSSVSGADLNALL